MKEFSKKISLCFMVLLGVLVMNLMVAERVRAADSDFIIDENGVLVEYVGSDSYVVIPEGVTKINHEVFQSNTNIIGIDIPDSVTRIGSWAFNGCTNLKNITIPNSVTSIDDYVFQYCNSLESITIPSFVTYIGDNPFSSCSNLININVSDQNINYKDEEGILFNKDGTELIAYPNGKSNTDYTIPESVTVIDNSAFSGCTNLTDIIIPSSVISIGYYSFRNCSSLISITIPESVIGIGDGAFRECSSLEGIIIPDSITSIGHTTFYMCYKLTNVVIPDSVTSIGDWAFAECISLTNINIPDSITNIGEYAFYVCKGLLSVNIPDSVVSIGSFAFGFCNRLESIFIHNDKIELGEKICIESNKFVVLYGYKGSNTEAYALQNEYNFKELEVLNPSIASNIVSIHPDKASMIGNNIEVSGNTSIGMNLTITAGSGGKLSVQNGTGIELLCGQSEIEIATGSAIELEYLFDIRVDEMDETQNIVFTLENITGEVCEQIEYTIFKEESEPENKPLQSIRLSKTDINLVKDRTSLLKVFYDPEDTTDPRAVTWTSSNREVAIVYTNGKVKAIGKGTAAITAKVGNLTATCNVTVTE